MKILAIDTATECCSAALWIDGQLLSREELSSRGHALRILPMVRELLREGAVALAQIDLIAFGRGPGAFTGVRLAASVTQGLAFSAQLPVMAISDLRAVAQQAFDLPGAAAHVLVCQDARMGEVYWGYFSSVAGFAAPCSTEAVAAPESVPRPEPGWRPCIGAGSGFQAYPALATHFDAELAALKPQLLPRAREIARLAAHDGPARAVPPEQAVPVYLRDNVAVKAPAAGHLS
ncbi:MAG TPA: tRNA (adenosine(37)-N6)-threonylcarbamoyltransferase complex dimerization subunit type 1 TsaB [Steroidobacteraceae bacterium]